MPRRSDLIRLLDDEGGSLHVEYTATYTLVAVMVVIMMTVLTERRDQLGGGMADTLDTLIGSFSSAAGGQANFGHAIYPGVDPERRTGYVEHEPWINRPTLRLPGQEQAFSLRSFVQPPSHITLEPAAGIRVSLDRQGRVRLRKVADHSWAVFDPRAGTWQLDASDQIGLPIDLLTAQRLGFVAPGTTPWRQLTIAPLALPIHTPNIGSIGSPPLDVIGAGVGAIAAALLGRRWTRSRGWRVRRARRFPILY